jgi:hypothetical protein
VPDMTGMRMSSSITSAGVPERMKSRASLPAQTRAERSGYWAKHAWVQPKLTLGTSLTIAQEHNVVFGNSEFGQEAKAQATVGGLVIHEHDVQSGHITTGGLRCSQTRNWTRLPRRSY